MRSSLARLLLSMAERRAAPAGRAWLAGIVASQERRGDRTGFLVGYASAMRKLGSVPLVLEPGETSALAAEGVDWPLVGWAIDHLGRAALLQFATDAFSEAEHAALVEECYRHGDTREREAVLRALPFLDRPGQLLPIGIDACRSHVQPVFEAICCENPFPARHFPDLHFNQMVLKALFTDVPLDRIVWLDRRRTPELARMAADYASERRLAGRSVPTDIGRLMAPARSDR